MFHDVSPLKIWIGNRCFCLPRNALYHVLKEMHDNTVTNLSWESSLLNIGTVQSNSKNSSWKSWMANILHDHDKWQSPLKLVVLRVCLIYVIYPCQSPNCGSDKTKPTLHVHVMIIMFINSLCHVMFYHVHSCSCHVYVISSSWTLNIMTFAEFLFLQVSRPTRFRPRMCFVRGTQIHENLEGWDFCLTWTNSNKSGSVFPPKGEGWSWKHIGTHFVKRVWMKMLVWLVSRMLNEIMVFICFFISRLFEGCQSHANLENHHKFTQTLTHCQPVFGQHPKHVFFEFIKPVLKMVTCQNHGY